MAVGDVVAEAEVKGWISNKRRTSGATRPGLGHPRRKPVLIWNSNFAAVLYTECRPFIHPAKLGRGHYNIQRLDLSSKCQVQ